MVEFETIVADQIPFGNNNFVEVARKKARDGETENVFISITRGFFAPNGEKRYKRSVAIPVDPKVIDFIATKIREV